jgi:hypothetical protein
MARFGFVGGSYTSRSIAVEDEECINWYVETVESGQGQSAAALYGTPGLTLFSALAGESVRALYWTGSRFFAVSGAQLIEIFSDGTQTVRGTVVDDGKPASIAATNIQLLVVSGGKAYCFTLATNALLDVTSLLSATPQQVVASDTYFIVSFQNSQRFQMSSPLDGTTWPGLQVNQVSVFAENIVSIAILHRELWVHGSKYSVVYSDTGSNEIFDVIPGAFIEQGQAATFGGASLDNTRFWIGQDDRGAAVAWRASGYTPQRISTFAVEAAWSGYSTIADAVSYTYQEGGHAFWVVYFPTANATWAYDVSTQLWHRRAFWRSDKASYEAHHSQCHAYAFGKHLVGDWSTGNIYQMSMALLDDNGSVIRRLRRAPTLSQEMVWMYHSQLLVDVDAGLGTFANGDGTSRGPLMMMRFSDDRGRTWSNEQQVDCGQTGNFTTRAIFRRLGRSRYRVYEITCTDPAPWVIIDSYLNATPGYAPTDRLTNQYRKQA